MRIAPYAPGDETSILALFSAAFDREFPPELWRWRFASNPCGAPIIFLAWDGERLASHYAVSPVWMSRGTERFCGALSGTTMTHPAYEGRGLFCALAEATYREMTARKMELVYGFPNSKSHRTIIERIGWTDIWEVPIFRATVDAITGLPQPDDVREVPAPDRGIDDLWHRRARPECVAVEKTHRYVMWRYAANPGWSYRYLVRPGSGGTAGFAVLKRYGSELQIVELMRADDVSVGLELVSAACGIARHEGLESVGLWLGVADPLHRALEKGGFRSGEPITYFGGRITGSGYGAGDMLDHRRWSLAMGDSDVF